MGEGDKITREEMRELFGDRMPLEAAKLLWDLPSTKTVDEIRAELRELAMTTATKDEPLTDEMLQGIKGHLEACRAKGHQNPAVDHMLLLIAEVERLRAENEKAYDAGVTDGQSLEHLVPVEGVPNGPTKGLNRADLDAIRTRMEVQFTIPVTASGVQRYSKVVQQDISDLLALAEQQAAEIERLNDLLQAAADIGSEACRDRRELRRRLGYEVNVLPEDPS